VVHHAPIARRNIDVTVLSSSLVRSNQPHVQPLLDLREEEVLATVDPAQGRGISKKDVRLTAQDRDYPGIPRGDRPVRDARSVGREYGTKFGHRVMGELNASPRWKQPDIKISATKKRLPLG
jgi:hypothetical protein